MSIEKMFRELSHLVDGVEVLGVIGNRISLRVASTEDSISPFEELQVTLANSEMNRELVLRVLETISVSVDECRRQREPLDQFVYEFNHTFLNIAEIHKG